jgi:hypothetical protein
MDVRDLFLNLPNVYNLDALYRRMLRRPTIMNFRQTFSMT